MGEKRKAQRIFVGKPEGKRPLGRHIRKGKIVPGLNYLSTTP
jgi:hypothetical protein